MTGTVDLTTEGTVAHVTLNNPARCNAIDTAMLAVLEAIVLQLGASRTLELAVLRADGPVFCAGTDLKQLDGLTPSDVLHWQRRTGELVERWARLELTTVTVFNGPAVGSGAVLGLASDIRVASDTTALSFPELGFGIPLTWSGIPLLVSLLGPDRLRRALLLGEAIGPVELQQLDLFAAVAPPGELVAVADRITAKLLSHPFLVRSMTKRAIAAAVAAPAFTINVYEPFLASLGVAARDGAPFAFKPGGTEA